MLTIGQIWLYIVKSRGRSPRCGGLHVSLSWGEGLLRARSNNIDVMLLR